MRHAALQALDVELSHIVNTGSSSTSDPLWTPGVLHTTLESAFLRARNRTTQRHATNDTQRQQASHDQPQPQAPSQAGSASQAAAPFASSALDGLPLDFADDLLWKVVQAWKDARGHGQEGQAGSSDATREEPAAGDTHDGEPLGDSGGSNGSDGGSEGSGGRRRLTQSIQRGNQGQEYANAFRLIFGNFFDLVGGGGW